MPRRVWSARAWGFPVLLLLFGLFMGLTGQSTRAQEGRKLLAQPAPAYPQMARHMQLTGTVKLEVTIGPDGQIRNTKVLGGHPLFVDAALEALKKWKYAPANTETTATVEFNFHP